MVIAEQNEKIIESVELINKTKVQSPRKAVAKSPRSEPIESNKFVPILGSYQGIYMTRLSTRPEDKGKQELSMPFLSTSAHNWISSLRTVTKSQVRTEKQK